MRHVDKAAKYWQKKYYLMVRESWGWRPLHLKRKRLYKHRVYRMIKGKWSWFPK
jgi:hypothetical protein